ncbi:transcriptional regulator [Microbacterium nanhaiense]|uniref:Transcriptional regulator n=1 Tax=Microbacterium nanhaiense TaxID=1301026 RepID=A0ABQ2N3H0_9MICO|nr:LacI family DNA-binding transcriptional regulator [Microbacterium nanhaiense]GGO64876.1 transcriptional regulator [Microbacterium nanhaiense]
MNIAEVARAAGVSNATVSRALSGRGSVSPATRERVLAAANELGYVVSQAASTLSSGRTRNVGVVLPFLDKWFFTQVLAGAQRRLVDSGYDVTLYNLEGDGSERRTVFDDFLLRQRVDAVIAVSLELDENEVSRLHALGKPLVGVGGPIPGVQTLQIDDAVAAHLATQHLISLGHTSLAHIGGDEASDADFHMPIKRRRGFAAAIEEAGLRPAGFVGADFTLEGGYRAAKQILGSPERPTAIFAASDEMAFGAILAARDLGLLVPHDVSIIGIDGHPQAEFFGLSTIAQYPRRQGARAAEILLAGLAGSAPPPSEVPFELITRTSTARPRP